MPSRALETKLMEGNTIMEILLNPFRIASLLFSSLTQNLISTGKSSQKFENQIGYKKFMLFPAIYSGLKLSDFYAYILRVN